MKLVFISGNHSRHVSVVRKLLESGVDVSWVVEQRENPIPNPPDDLDHSLRKLFKMHFIGRQNAEFDFFGNGIASDLRGDTNTYEVSLDSLNTRATRNFIVQQNANLILSYGCHKLDPEILEISGPKKWNIHGGLSPWYRGTATHFWPSYMLEPQFTGMTLHETTSQIDGGNIVFQTASQLIPTDGIHENACRAVSDFSIQFVRRIKSVDIEKVFAVSPTTTGRIWTSRMWTPHHLRMVYEKFDNKINRYVLDNNLAQIKPALVDVLN
jgi:methionyl-tRNA formyltransferase